MKVETIGDATLYLGDCLEILPTLEAGSVDAVVTDPPYLDGDMSAIIDEFTRVAKRAVFTPGKLESFNWIARRRPDWEYAWQSNSRSMGGSACMHITWEPVLSYGMPVKPVGSDLLIFPIGQPDQKNGHIWPKPEALYRKLVSHWSIAGGLVLDPFMGSGTTGVAALRLGRRFVGIEIEPKYFEIACRRIEQENRQLKMF